MRAFVLAAALCAAAPAFAQEAPPENAAPPPGVADVAVQIGAGQAGETISAKLGDKIAIELVGTPSSGYLWSVAGQPDFLSAPSAFTGPLIAPPPGGRPLLGGKKWEVFVFTVNEAGSGAVKLEQHGPRSPDASASFDVTINAQ
jgi:hypothetical protein